MKEVIKYIGTCVLCAGALYIFMLELCIMFMV